ncbi:LysR family transcriptional regulator [Lentibacter algarum]|uniref:LysR family transcriptional regulator n=1 Tax=Lentibacter algarum TaxID=576131 RepID=UPI001C08F02D|nr:LysR family transcriptional regulator [Lentibacter algarum]MBU2983109.1 LysR family transcriptional regulator [Lentibacter algarum]
MDNMLSSLNWSLVQAFLAVAETGSLSEAARRLKRSQPTLGRQIQRIEKSLGVELFQRHARGLELTQTGALLLEPAQNMRAAAKALELAAEGQDTSLEGAVRITASEFVAHHILPPALARLRQDAPGINLTLLPSNTTENLLFREADIAVRMYRPDQLDVVTKKIGEIGVGIFASQSYLARTKKPQAPEDLPEHDLVGYHQNPLIIEGMRAAGIPADESWFTVKCDDQTVYWELVRAGCGIGFSQTSIGINTPDMVQLFPELPIPRLPVWLAVPKALQHTPRVRHVWNALEEGLKPHVS